MTHDSDLSNCDAPVVNGGSCDADGVHRQDNDGQADETACQPSDGHPDAGEMSRSKRIDAILQSKTFRDELDRLLGSGVIDDNSVGGCLEHISNMVGLAKRDTGRSGDAIKGYQCVRPVCDLRGVEGTQFSTREKTLRCKLACLFRLVDALGWTDDCGSHFVLLLDEGEPSALFNPGDLLYSQLSASTLQRVPLSQLGQAGVDAALHAPLLQAGAACVLHVRHAAVCAVSALRCGLLPLTEFACALGPVEQVSGAEQVAAWAGRRLSAESRAAVVLVNNCGALCCADTVECAFFLLANLVAACEAQLSMMPLGVDNLSLLDESEQQRCQQEWSRVFSSGGDGCDVQFEAGIRLLERAGCRTGHASQLPLLSSLSALSSRAGCDLLTDDASASPSRKITMSRAGERNRWLGQQTAESKV